MKTATIDLYEIHGTSTLQADILYRGKLVHSISINQVHPSAANKPGMLHVAKEWVRHNGFSDYRLK